MDFIERDVSTPGFILEFRECLQRVTSLPQIFAEGEHLGELENPQTRLCSN
ncbi:MAG: hypothetical protein GY802_15625 [Gammaproteobacteria bacterium]|nr:hypothetical protein [Gammaproteobacteria bacterium]